ncbi:hypothetical protein FHS18_006628 [Paenibacillus phyllosphaerae]|uniref:Uncharacterized protein n=1 Tax=Paenibacillus phyllosphaerae TaxID=274593 RepID=A0A7W5FRN9_9BACL|nr:hypothetical protein [Paenibacillus phyllosphaerae]MBB3114507.1 hypothetical protein [Paenibacillus phyllosphaerae]
MKRSAITSLISHWENKFLEQTELTQYTSGPDYSLVPSNIQNLFRYELFPQPFYGYLNDDMSEDIFMPLLNPGPVSEKQVKELFKGLDYDEAKRQWNKVIIERHTKGWTKEKFLDREKEYDLLLGPSHWRRKKLEQVQRVIGGVSFLHTVELFPFHSDRWKAGMVSQEKWFRDMPSTQLAIESIEEIAALRLVKHILGVGLPWADILKSYPNKFYLDGDPVFLFGSKGRIAHRFFKFKPKMNSKGLPIVIYSGCSMNLPVNKREAIDTLREMLEINL